MFTTHQYQAAPARTTLLLVTAILLGLLSCNLWGADIRRVSPVRPGPLPAGTEEAAVPMNEACDASFAASARQSTARQASEQQDLRNWSEAAAIWPWVSVPLEGEVWRHLSLGVTLLNLGDLDLADEPFRLARER